MTLAQYAQFSNYAVASGTVVVALAFLAHVAEWGLARRGGQKVTAVAQRGGVLVDDEQHPRSSHPTETLGRIGVSLTVLAASILGGGVLARSLAAQRVPWSNMYEFGVAGALIALTVYLVCVLTSGARWLGVVITGFALTLLGLAMTTYVPAGPVVPALHSYWLVIHVAAVMISGGLFLVGAAASVLFLIKSRAEARGATGPMLARLPSLGNIDRLAYRVHAVAFPIWTFGALIAGPIWAQYAWGRYWGWDPKEVWAFITWVVYAGYLHARATAGWRGKRAAYIAIIGFATFLFSYYGINLYGSGLHSYAK